MLRYSTYILLCADDSYYTGVTNDVQKRLKEHEDGLDVDSYTANRLPVKLVWWQEYIYVDRAIAREKQIKGWSRIKKEALINGISQTLPSLSKKKFPIKGK